MNFEGPGPWVSFKDADVQNVVEVLDAPCPHLPRIGERVLLSVGHWLVTDVRWTYTPWVSRAAGDPVRWAVEVFVRRLK